MINFYTPEYDGGIKWNDSDLNRKQTVKNRIASISQPHVRSIVKGKTKATTEFEAQFEISVFDGYFKNGKIKLGCLK